jgi:hypothetical protein
LQAPLGLLGGEDRQQRQRYAAACRVSHNHDPFSTLCDEAVIGGDHIVDRRWEWVFGREPIVSYKGIGTDPHGNLADKVGDSLRRTEHIAAPMNVENSTRISAAAGAAANIASNTRAREDCPPPEISAVRVRSGQLSFGHAAQQCVVGR